MNGRSAPSRPTTIGLTVSWAAQLRQPSKDAFCLERTKKLTGLAIEFGCRRCRGASGDDKSATISRSKRPCLPKVWMPAFLRDIHPTTDGTHRAQKAVPALRQTCDYARTTHWLITGRHSSGTQKYLHGELPEMAFVGGIRNFSRTATTFANEGGWSMSFPFFRNAVH